LIATKTRTTPQKKQNMLQANSGTEHKVVKAITEKKHIQFSDSGMHSDILEYASKFEKTNSVLTVMVSKLFTLFDSTWQRHRGDLWQVGFQTFFRICSLSILSL